MRAQRVPAKKLQNLDSIQLEGEPNGVWLLPVKAFNILPSLGFTAQRFTPVKENKEKKPSAKSQV